MSRWFTGGSRCVHLVEDVVNSCLLKEGEVQENDRPGPDFSIILAGFSWENKKPVLYIIFYDEKSKKMKAQRATTIMGVEVAVIGDYELIPKVRGKIYHAFDKAEIKRGKTVGYEPLDVLTEYIDNGEVYTVGGHLQMLKIYPYSRVLPVGFFYPNDKRIYFYGRPLLKYETFPYPIYDMEEKVFKYMKVNSNEFELVHEKIEELKKFKKREMKNP